MHHASFVADLAIVLGVAALSGLLFQLLQLPSVLGYLLAGLIVGPYIPIPLFADPERVHSLSEFGVVLVMFSVGLEFRIQKFLSVLPLSGITALVEIGGLMWCGYGLGRFLGWNETRSLFLGACICISSTMAVSKILEQRPVAQDSRTLIFGVLVLQDVAAIALIAVMTVVAQGADASFGEALGILGKLLVVLVAIIACGMFFIPRLVRRMVATKSAEVLAVGAVGLCFSFALLTEHLQYSAALGAFIAGILVAESGQGRKVEHGTAGLRDVFAAVFFVSVGMTVDPRVAAGNFGTSLIVLGVIIFAQLLTVSIGGLLSGSGLRRSVTAGLGLGQIGEFAFIIAGIGTAAGVLQRELQSILVTVAVLSTFTTALSIRLAEPLTGFLEQRLPSRLLRMLSLYESWLDSLRSKTGKQDGGVSHVLLGLALDFGIMVATTLAWRAFSDQIGTFLVSNLSLGSTSKQTAATFALGCTLLPPVVPMILSARKLSHRLASRALGDEDSPARRMFVATFAMVALACLGIPLTLLLAPLANASYLWALLLIGLIAGGLIAWKRAMVVEGELESGALFMLRAIADQSLPEVARETPGLIHGYGDLVEWSVAANSYALGRSLAELQVRSLTGANVVALRQGEDSLGLPSPTQPLALGDTLVIAGCKADQEAAVELFSLGAGPTRTSIFPTRAE